MSRELLALILIAGGLAGTEQPPEIGQPAPAFELNRLDGGQTSLAEHRGRPILVNFWATWCKPCRDEMPEIVQRYNELHPSGLEVLAVNLTDQERKRDVKRFAQELQMPFPILLDVKGKVSRLYRLRGVPTTIFVDSAGVIAAVHNGPMTPTMLDDGIGKILNHRDLPD